MLLYSVDDLRHWKYEGIWFSSEDPLAARHLPAEIWECPQLVRVPDSSGAETWVLMASLWLPADEHDHPNGVGYLLGSLAANRSGLPVFTPASGGKADLGREFYAPQLLALPDRALLWGWSGEIEDAEGRPGRSQAETDDAGWAGILTFPRQLSVHGGVLAVEPAPELRAYRGARLHRGAAGTLALPAGAEVRVAGERARSGWSSSRRGSGGPCSPTPWPAAISSGSSSTPRSWRPTATAPCPPPCAPTPARARSGSSSCRTAPRPTSGSSGRRQDQGGRAGAVARRRRARGSPPSAQRCTPRSGWTRTAAGTCRPPSRP